MYPDDAYCEFYPKEIVEKVLREHPYASIERKNSLMQAEWDRVRPVRESMAQLADDLGL